MSSKQEDKIQVLSGTGVWVWGDDLDTDRIIPARYLKCVTFDGLGDFAFYDDRYDVNGDPKKHPLNDSRFAGSCVLLSGRNFGCGSSREHAPQSLFRAGFRLIVAESFAEIFFGNCTTLGLVCVAASRADITRLGEMIIGDPGALITFNLDNCEIKCGNFSFPGTIPATARGALQGGYWDPLSELLAGADAVKQTYGNLAYREWVR